MPTAVDFGGERCDRIVAAVLARLQPALEAARQEPARRPPLPSRGRPGGADPG
jgi:hypothetical protein